MKIFSKDQNGFGLIESLLVFGMIAVVGGGLYLVVGKNDKKTSEKITTQQTTPAKNPFPAKPTVTASGDWRGSYTVENPDACAGDEGSWQATLKEKDGILSGSYSTKSGLSGKIRGKLEADKASWSVSNGTNGIKFSGAIKGNTMNGSFTGVQCSSQSLEHTTGTFFGGRIVQ